jgi:hypothetical protein
MDLYKELDCTDTFLDMVCYEVLKRRLSPEMEDILDRHLKCCPSCRRKVIGLGHIHRSELVRRHFG